MSDAPAARAVVAGHGSFADGIVSAVGHISGRSGALRAVTNEGCDAAGIEAAIGRALDELGAHVVFTDLPAGSCTMAARRLARARGGVTVVVGASAAAVLDFVMGEAGANADAVRAAGRGRESLTVFEATGPARGD